MAIQYQGRIIIFIPTKRIDLKKHIPNTITLINLACGCIGTVYCLEGNYLYVLLLMAVAMIADFADGLMAKVLNARSELGLQLDSLADLVTFGLLPGMILYILIADALPATDRASFLRPEHLGFAFTLFAALRLGKFNIDTRQTDSFIGLATPAASIFVAGLLLIRHFDVQPFAGWLDNPAFPIAVTLVLSVLMVSEIPMFSFKVKGTMWTGNEARVTFIILSIVLALLLKWACLPPIILLYIIISVAENTVRGKRKAPGL
jgi:CDP-diacylglycerol--serine O-phosphatidyltransferase